MCTEGKFSYVSADEHSNAVLAGIFNPIAVLIGSDTFFGKRKCNAAGNVLFRRGMNGLIVPV